MAVFTAKKLKMQKLALTQPLFFAQDLGIPEALGLISASLGWDKSKRVNNWDNSWPYS